MKQEIEKKSKNFEYKNFSIEIKAKDEEKGIIEAYVSIFGNIDMAKEIIDQGAFKESLAKKLPKGVWAHNWDQPIAKTLEAREDEKGLYIKGQFNLDTQRGREAFSDIIFGTMDEFSIGYRVNKDETDEEGIRHLIKLRLYEWSPVLVGANTETELISAKSDNEKKKKTENVLANKSQEMIEGVVETMKELKNQLLDTISSLNNLLSEKVDKGEKKVASIPDKKIIRIRRTIKRIDRDAESILRLTKTKKNG